MDKQVIEQFEQEFSGLQYGDFLCKFFGMMLHDDATVSDMKDFIKFIETQLGITLAELDKQVQVGVSNGYAAEDQLTIICHFMKIEKKQTGTETKFT